MLTEDLEKSVHDLRFLLNRGYPRNSAVEFVSDHYLLNSEERHFLVRSVYSKDEIEAHESKLMDISKIEDSKVKVDGYNVLITVERLLRGELVIRCDDGVLRDLQADFGSYKLNEYTEQTVDKILDIFENFDPKQVYFYFDKPVSKSGELAGFVRDQISERGISGGAEAVEGVDKEVWDSEVSASSDSVIIEKAENIIDIPSEILSEGSEEFVDLKRI